MFLVVVVALTIVPSGSSVNSWSDPVGDSGAAPDITYVTVSDTTAKVVTFRVVAHFVANTGVNITVDAVKNGVEIAKPRSVWMSVAADGSLSSGVNWFRGAAIPEIPVTATTSADAATVSFPAPALDIEDMFVFRLYSFGNSNVDNVPDFSGMLFYKMTPPAPPPPPPVVTPVISSPVAWDAPVAGKRFALHFRITRSDDGTAATTATVACTTTLAGKTIPHRHAFKNGTLNATLGIPKGARGKTLRIAVKVTLGRQTETKVVTFKVK